jgi:glycosyltransferase involved in cell wall biosynthesis
MQSARPDAPHPDRPRRVLIIAAEFPPLGGGGVIRATKLAKYLSLLGWDVDVACSDEPLADAVDTTLLDELPASVTIHRVRPPMHGVTRAAASGAKRHLPREALWFRALYGARQAARAIIAIPDRWLPWALTIGRTQQRRQAAPTVIVSSGPPHSVHVAGVMLARRWGVPYVADLRDEWTLRPMTHSRLPWRSALERRLERWCLKQCAYAVFVSNVSCERYSAAYPSLAHKFRVIPNGYDPADFAGLDLSREPAGAVVRIGHAGSIDQRRDGGPFFQALGRRLRRQQAADVALTMVGPISARQRKIAETEIHEDRLELTPFLPHREALARMVRCDVLLVLTNTEEAGPAALTSKIFEYLAMRRPILVVAHPSAATKLVHDSGAGVWADPGSPDELDDAIEASVRLARQDVFSGMDEGELQHYDRERQAHVWDRLLREATGEPT